MFDREKQPDGRYAIRNVPIFKEHMDRGYACDEQWLDRCVADFWAQHAESTSMADGNSKYAMLPPITIGHTPENPDAPEPPRAGFIDNLRRVGRMLVADFVDLPKTIYKQIVDGFWPYRSAEVIPSKHRLTNVSLLGGRYPHFSLPVMRFKLDGLERVRYTLGTQMPPTTRRQSYMGEMNDEYAAGGEEPPANEMSGGMDIEAIAQAVAPIVAELLAQGQGNSPEVVDSAGAYRHRNGRGFKNVQRHEENDAGEHTSQTADAAESDAVRPSSDEETADHTKSVGDSTEDFKGHKMENDKMTLKATEQMSPEVRRYISKLQNTVNQQSEQIAGLNNHVTELRRHNAKQAQAAKRHILMSKCREIAGLGYAIGNSEAIDRHVERMMAMPPAEVKAYVDDVLKNYPKINIADKHTVHDVVSRPGAFMDENERYVAEDPQRAQDLGLDTAVLQLSDMLG